MRTQHGNQVRYLAVCISSTVFAIAFVLVPWLDLPRLWYLPLAHRWAVAPSNAFTREDMAMGWYGQALLASALAATAFVAVARLRRPIGRRALTAASIALIAAQVAAIVTLIVDH